MAVSVIEEELGIEYKGLPSVREKIEESRPSSGRFWRYKGLPSIFNEDIENVPESSDYNNLEQRLQKLEGRTISDIDLDNMTKPSNAVSEDIDVEKYLREREDVTRAEPMSMRGVSSMQQKDFPYATPDQQKNVVNEIRKGLEDPARAMSEGATAEEVEIVKSMTDAQLLEFVEAMNQQTMDEDTGEETLEDKALRLVDPSWEEFPTPFNTGGRVSGLAGMGRGGDTQLAHVMTGERMVPPGVMDDGMLDAAFVRAGLDPREYTVGSTQASTNPMTGMPEYGLGSFIKRLFKKVKKLAPVIGAAVGFSYGGPTGAGIGKALGGVIKTGDLDFQKALSDFGTGWALGNFGKGMGLQEGSVFKKASEGGMWGIDPQAGGEGVGGFIQSAGAKLAGGEDINLMEQFKDLPWGQKLGVGALGLAALSQTGMFDKKELGETPPEIAAGIQDLRAYNERPLRVGEQVDYSFDPSLGKPVGVTQFKSIDPRNKSLAEVLEDLNKNKIAYNPSSIAFG